MKYFKIKQQSNGIRYRSTSSDKLIANELLTDGDLKRMRANPDIIAKHADIIEISSRKTYISFGARFQNKVG